MKNNSKKFYVARNNEGSLLLFTERPEKLRSIWLGNGIVINSELFPSVKHEDEEPTEVEITIKKK